MRRKFFEAKETKPREAHEALAWIARLYEIEREAKNASHDERQALRQERSLPLLTQFREWLLSLTGRVLPKSPFGQAVHYVLPRWGRLRALLRRWRSGDRQQFERENSTTLRDWPQLCELHNYAHFDLRRGQLGWKS